MDTINIGIKFVKSSSPVPCPTPVTPTTDPSINPANFVNDSASVLGSLAQTGDLSMSILIAFIAFALLLSVGVFCLLTKFVNTEDTVLIKSFKKLHVFVNSSLYVKLQKVRTFVILAPSAFCLICCSFVVYAFADNPTEELQIDKPYITATVTEDGTFTIDTCSLNNLSEMYSYTISSTNVSIDSSVKNIDNLSATNIKISGLNGTIFSGNPDSTSPYIPLDINALDAKSSAKLSFEITFSDKSIINQLIGKQVFSISLLPQIKEDWKPMQVQTANGKSVDFYPVFKDKAELLGYRFAIKNGESYDEIFPSNPTIGFTMADFYSALQPESGVKNRTLYYWKLATATKKLNCYTVKDFVWDDVFVVAGEDSQTKYPKVATGYTESFLNNYCSCGISTAELDTDLCLNWNVNESGNKTIPTINGFTYEQFYSIYGKNEGGLLSYGSLYPWGSCVLDGIMALSFRCFSSENNTWMKYGRNLSRGIVLHRDFS